MNETPNQIAIWKTKADKWDELDLAIGKFYPTDENGNELEDEGGDLGDIGECAASAFGYL